MSVPAPDAALNGLRRERPEWEPWLAVVDEIVREAARQMLAVALQAEVPAYIDARA